MISKTASLTEKSLKDTKCLFHLSLQILFEIFSASKNIYRVAFQISVETHVGFHVKYPLLSDFHQIWNVSKFNKTSQYGIKYEISYYENPFCGSGAFM
jgi:hypothetical protein